MLDINSVLFNYSNKQVINTFGLTIDQYERLSNDVKQMLIHEYWFTICNRINKNEMDLINENYSSKLLKIKRK